MDYRHFMMAQGLRPATPPTDGKGAIWCAWGYGRTVPPQQVYDTLPTVKQLGFKWVTLDDGWQDNVGDWALDPKKFANRDDQEGFRAQLWWSPLSSLSDAELLRDHPDYALLNKDGSRRKISWWNSYYCVLRMSVSSWSTTRLWCGRFCWTGDSMLSSSANT